MSLNERQISGLQGPMPEWLSYEFDLKRVAGIDSWKRGVQDSICLWCWFDSLG